MLQDLMTQHTDKLARHIWQEERQWQALLNLPAEQQIDVYLDLKSPHAYLAVRPTLELARDFAIELNFLPYTLSYTSLGVSTSVEADMQRRPPSAAADRKARMYYTTAREYAALQNLPLRTPHRLLDSDLAHRVFLFAKQQHREIAFAMWVYLAGWASGWRDFELEDKAALQSACIAAEVDVANLDEFIANDGEAEQALKEISQRAETQGIVGVPHYVFTDPISQQPMGLFGREHLALIRHKLFDAGLARSDQVSASFSHTWPAK